MQRPKPGKERSNRNASLSWALLSRTRRGVRSTVGMARPSFCSCANRGLTGAVTRSVDGISWFARARADNGHVLRRARPNATRLVLSKRARARLSPHAACRYPVGEGVRIGGKGVVTGGKIGLRASGGKGIANRRGTAKARSSRAGTASTRSTSAGECAARARVDRLAVWVDSGDLQGSVAETTTEIP